MNEGGTIYLEKLMKISVCQYSLFMAVVVISWNLVFHYMQGRN